VKTRPSKASWILSFVILGFFTFVCCWISWRLVAFFLAVYRDAKEASLGHYIAAVVLGLGCIIGFAACGSWLLALIRRDRLRF
jgi:hypothetical protein